MQKRANAVTFKGKPLTVIGPQLKAGDSAPSFTCVTSGLEPFSLSNLPAKTRLFSVVPSLDTPVCHDQTVKFNQALEGMKDKVACYTVSLDMPFAQKRFCGVESINNMQTLSDLHDRSFGTNWGLLIEGLPIPLLQRAVFVVDKNNKITYCEYVPEVGAHPNYDKALAALTAAG
jgi:thiol peroxidase